MKQQDLNVDIISSSLKGKVIDVVVSGSIAAVESVRFVRALRRLGASVRVFISTGAKMFITPMALEWASKCKVYEDFEGSSTHLCSADACVVAPASADMISKIACGICDNLCSTLVCSYLGSDKPVYIVPAMHESLYNSFTVQKNIEFLSQKCKFLQSRNEEDKKKFPDPNVLSSEISYLVNQFYNESKRSSLIVMGSCKGYIDNVRYISNYSSGGLGTCISEELYRYGVDTTVVCGSCSIKPRFYSKLINVETNEQLSSSIKELMSNDREYDLSVCLASVLDFIPKNKVEGKIRSYEDLKSIELVKAPKIIEGIFSKIKIGFKLEVDSNEKDVQDIVKDYMNKYDLNYIVVNYLKDVDSTKHKAIIYSKDKEKKELNSKIEIALYIVKILLSSKL